MRQIADLRGLKINSLPLLFYFFAWKLQLKHKTKAETAGCEAGLLVATHVKQGEADWYRSELWYKSEIVQSRM